MTEKKKKSAANKANYSVAEIEELVLERKKLRDSLGTAQEKLRLVRFYMQFARAAIDSWGDESQMRTALLRLYFEIERLNP